MGKEPFFLFAKSENWNGWKGILINMDGILVGSKRESVFE